MSSSNDARDYSPGDVFQINEKHGRYGWIGAFVLATEIESFGIQGFVARIETHDEQKQAYIRLPWDQIDYIGRALLVPENVSLVRDSVGWGASYVTASSR